jgi:ATP-binding cassette subfamily B (MDR/TAP) protein 1
MGELVQFTFTLIGGVAYAFYSSWQATLISLTVIPFMSLSTFFLIKVTTTQSARASETYAEAGGIVFNTVSSIRTILSLNAVQSMITKYSIATQKILDVASGLASWIGLANGAMMGSFLLSYCAIALYGSYLLYDAVRGSGCDPSGTVPGATYCVPRGAEVFGALMGMTMAAGVLPQVSVSIEAINGARAACFPAVATMKRQVGSDELEDADNKENHAHRRGEHAPLPKYAIDSSSEDGFKPASVQGDLVFDNVSFAYPTRSETNVFNGFSLRIAPGKTVALVGASGSGKSTTVQLIERFYDPTAGSLSLDGNDLRSLNVKWLRSQIGLVGQEPALFACSIRENIRYGKPDATEEEIESAARNAYCHDFISAFPDGYDTQVGDKGMSMLQIKSVRFCCSQRLSFVSGAQLSGGQKQRIAIARVLIKQPKILLLDEATSALDSESEGIVQAALDRLLQANERTTIVIAHKLSTVKNADMICVVHEGQVAETGTHDQLMARNGHYFALVEAQKQEKKVDRNEADSSLRIISESVHTPQTVVSTVVADRKHDTLMRFRDVHFCYPSRPENEIFRGLNLTIFDGETLALVGPSGHGM